MRVSQKFAMATLCAAIMLSVASANGSQLAPAPGADRNPMMLTTTAWPDGGDIPLRYTEAVPLPVSPGFKWANAPVGTASFVFLMRDLDGAVSGGTDDNLHWLVWNIPAAAFGLAENVPRGDRLPSGSRQAGRTGSAYSGPDAPASGPRRHYVFELLALDIMPDIETGDAAVTRSNLFQAMQGHVLGRAVWFGLFRRPN